MATPDGEFPTGIGEPTTVLLAVAITKTVLSLGIVTAKRKRDWWWPRRNYKRGEGRAGAAGFALLPTRLRFWPNTGSRSE